MSDRTLADTFWDLRDHAYDHPGHWAGVTAEEIFQRLGELIEQAAARGKAEDWLGVAPEMIAWRTQQLDR